METLPIEIQLLVIHALDDGQKDNLIDFEGQSKDFVPLLCSDYQSGTSLFCAVKPSPNLQDLLSIGLVNHYFNVLVHSALKQKIERIGGFDIITHPPWSITYTQSQMASVAPQPKEILHRLNTYIHDMRHLGCMQTYRPWLFERTRPAQPFPIPRLPKNERFDPSKLSPCTSAVSKCKHINMGVDWIIGIPQNRLLGNGLLEDVTIVACIELKALWGEITLTYDRNVDAIVVSTRDIDSELSREKQKFARERQRIAREEKKRLAMEKKQRLATERKEMVAKRKKEKVAKQKKEKTAKG
ncbi:uncharacterized protein KY384_007335 [Bacidia gigantensis]|uniref:uncharacterized protein n=1 Tax=Bacidia gigantensis TaxID=2732470 RepID=UPI001D03A858|nr:uncharacterized protein KY384_007335 [Bacidia gigantensis]KAG8528417.1 hypothetical protein KY384_007335 [Bacidia gigantensis]